MTAYYLAVPSFMSHKQLMVGEVLCYLVLLPPFICIIALTEYKVTDFLIFFLAQFKESKKPQAKLRVEPKSRHQEKELLPETAPKMSLE
jgi:hypothetical protein